MKNIGLVFLISISFWVLACSKTTNPELDETPPNIVLDLSVYTINANTPHSISFFIMPRGSSDNFSSYKELQVRWDFENDGEWDTEFQDLVSIADFVPKTLPSDTWVVKCEMKDMAGNVSTHTESYQLPGWVATPPDVIAGEIRLLKRNSGSALGDTLNVGEDFYISLPRQDWLNEDDVVVTQRYFVDNQLVGENFSEAVFPDPIGLRFPINLEHEGIHTTGVHEIRVELEMSGDQTESNVENNSASRIVYVVD
jgi:hypothetical protein